jgi:hypothetical protein
MATSRALAVRASARPLIRAGLTSFRATESSRSRCRVSGSSGDTHADDRTRQVLRDLSGDLERNAEGYQIMIHAAARLMGAPTPRPLVGPQDWRERVVAAWRSKASRTRGGFDARGMLAWPALCPAWWRAMWLDGDIGVIPRSDGTLASIEADLIAGGRSKNQHARVVGGVAYDGAQQVIGYYVCPRTAAGTPQESAAQLVGAEQMTFLAHLWRLSNSRGVPLISAGLDNAERVDALVEAEVISAEQASNLYGAMQRQPAAGQFSPAVPLADAAAAPAALRSTDGTNPALIDFPAGTYWDLPPGMEWKPYSPTRPNLNVVEMLRQMLRQSCAHLGIPFSVLFADFTGVNWSGNRGLVSLTRDALTWWRGGLLEPFLAPIWSWWIGRELASGRLPWPTDNGRRIDPALLLTCAWDWPMPEWPDPSREAEALDLRLTQQTTSLSRTIGPDWPLIVAEREREQILQDASYIRRCQEAHKAVDQAAIPGLTWREVVNRDASANTITTIPTDPKSAADETQDQDDHDDPKASDRAVAMSYDSFGHLIRAEKTP